MSIYYGYDKVAGGGSGAGQDHIKCTKAEYDAMSSHDPNKIYCITDEDTGTMTISPIATQGNVIGTVNENGVLKTLFSGPVGGGSVLSGGGGGWIVDTSKEQQVLTSSGEITLLNDSNVYGDALNGNGVQAIVYIGTQQNHTQIVEYIGASAANCGLVFPAGTKLYVTIATGCVRAVPVKSSSGSGLSSGGSGSGAIFYDWSLIDGVNYGANLTMPTTSATARTVDRDCLFAWFPGMTVYVNGKEVTGTTGISLASIPTMPVVANSGAGGRESVSLYLKSGDSFYGANDAHKYALIPIKSYGGSSSTSGGNYIDMDAVSEIHTESISTTETNSIEIPYNCILRTESGNTFYVNILKNGTKYRIGQISDAGNSSPIFKKGQHITLRGTTSETITFVPVS